MWVYEVEIFSASGVYDAIEINSYPLPPGNAPLRRRTTLLVQRRHRGEGRASGNTENLYRLQLQGLGMLA